MTEPDDARPLEGWLQTHAGHVVHSAPVLYCRDCRTWFTALDEPPPVIAEVSALRALTQRLARAHDALRHYGCHEPACALNPETATPCSCGLDAACGDAPRGGAR